MIEFKLDILDQAIDNCTNIELRQAAESTEEVLFFSRFRAIYTINDAVIIDFPIASAALKVLKISDPVWVKFLYNQVPYIFKTTVIDLTGINFPEEKKREIMILARPKMVLGEERRNDLKLSTPPFDITVHVSKSKDILKQYKKKTYQAITLNISAGGIAIKEKREKLPLSKGDLLEFCINLPEKSVRIEGELLNVYEPGDGFVNSYGIKFCRQNIDRITYRRSISSISRYVVRRERELLSRR